MAGRECRKPTTCPIAPRGMDHAIAYKGVASRSVDLTDVYTTDAEIAYHDLAVLEDDKKYFPRLLRSLALSR